MRTRAERHGGSFTITARDGGTVVKWHIPVPDGLSTKVRTVTRSDGR